MAVCLKIYQEGIKLTPPDHIALNAGKAHNLYGISIK
jgi:hypothetical protein